MNPVPRRVTPFIVIILVLFLMGCSGPGASPVVPPERDTTRETSAGMGNMPGLLSGTAGPSDDYWRGNIELDGLTWEADFSPDGDIHRALGKGLKLEGSIDEFINAHPDIFQVGADNLWLMTNDNHDGIKYVIYRQAYNGIPVLDSRVDLRFGRGGKLVMLGADVFPEISDVPGAGLSRGYAMDIAASCHEGEVRECELYIKPVYDGAFVPVWRTFVGDWLMLISAVDGGIVEETEMVWDYDFEGTVEGEVNEYDPFNPSFITYLPDVRVRFWDGDNSYDDYCDETGAYHYSTDLYTEMTTQVRILGKWINVNNKDGSDADITVITHEGVPAEFLFDDANTAPTEANVYYWASTAHNYIKNIDPDFTPMDFMLTANVNRYAWCNANASWNSINFYKEDAGCLNLGEIADVIIHEYGHVVTYRHYNSSSIPPGEIHEGFSDYLAATVTDQPVIGVNYKGPGTYIRNCDNELYWPDNKCGGESHCLGEYLAGALWDLRDLLGRETSDHLWWFAKYGKPTTFPDVATEICIVDDDNDDLSDGTPHYTEIYISFEYIHGIPVPDAPDYVDLTLTVTPDDPNIEISRTTGGSFGFDMHVVNNLPIQADVEGWVAVLRPNGMWYGPMIPPGHYKASPVPLYFNPNADFSYHLTQNIPAGLPLGAVYEYHVRLGDYVDMENDDIKADDYFTFTIVE